MLVVLDEVVGDPGDHDTVCVGNANSHFNCKIKFYAYCD